MQRLRVCIHRRFSPGRPSCGEEGERIVARLREEAARRGLAVEVGELDCFGQCELGPNVRLVPGGRFFHGVSAGELEEILEAVRLALAEEAPEVPETTPQ